jgi:hypothetical protein
LSEASAFPMSNFRAIRICEAPRGILFGEPPFPQRPQPAHCGRAAVQTHVRGRSFFFRAHSQNPICGIQRPSSVRSGRSPAPGLSKSLFSRFIQKVTDLTVDRPYYTI